MTDPQAAEPQDVNQTDASGENSGVARQRDFKECCFVLRENLEKEKQATYMLMGHPVFAQTEIFTNQQGEMRANIMLAYRHLEDARMRLGKAIQAYDGGESRYPR